MPDVAVLGAGGFLGSAVAGRLIEEGAEVRVVARRDPQTPTARAVWDRAADRRLVDLSREQAPLSDCSAVYHFAADMGGVGYLTSAQVTSYVTNSRITFNVLEGIERDGVERSFFAASACAYPVELQTGPEVPLLREDQLDQGTPDKLYGREKRSMIALAAESGSDIRVGVLHTVYGIGQELSGPRTKFPPALVVKALAARSSGRIEVWGDGSQRRSFLWVDDAVEKILRMMRMPYEGPTNIGLDGAISVDDAVAICASELGIDPEIVHLPSEPTGPMARDCDNTLWDRRYGEMPLIDHRDGFARMLEWAASLPALEREGAAR